MEKKGSFSQIEQSFINSEVAGMVIDRYSIASMQKEPMGSFTVANMMDIEVKDDLGTLKLAFSGIFMWLHLISLIVWLAPYIVYISWVAWVSKPLYSGRNEEEQYLIEKLWGFIRNANEQGLFFESLRIVIFFSLFLYNLNRLYLLVLVNQ